MNRAYYSDDISAFLARSSNDIVGILVQKASAEGSTIESSQIDAWLEQISILKPALMPYSSNGTIYFEYTVPRLGRGSMFLGLSAQLFLFSNFKFGETQFKLSARLSL